MAGPIRQAFVMSVDPQQVDEYRRRHNPIWPELEETLLAHGVRSYSIFHHPDTHQLFAYVEFASEEQWNSIADTEVCQRWWKHMAPLMPSDETDRPLSTPLNEVFHLEA